MKMGKEILTFGNIGIEKDQFYHCKKLKEKFKNFKRCRY